MELTQIKEANEKINERGKKNNFLLIYIKHLYSIIYRQYTDLAKVTEKTTIYGTKYW